MSSLLKQLKDEAGNKIYPVSTSNAVYHNDEQVGLIIDEIPVFEPAGSIVKLKDRVHGTQVYPEVTSNAVKTADGTLHSTIARLDREIDATFQEPLGERVKGDTPIIQANGDVKWGSPHSVPISFEVDAIKELKPNTLHVWEIIPALTVTLGPTISEGTQEYMFQFKSGETPTVLTLPEGLIYIKIVQIEANKTYQCSILNNTCVLVGENEPTGTGITEAPLDGKQYARKNAGWIEVEGGTSSSNFLDGGEVDSIYGGVGDYDCGEI